MAKSVEVTMVYSYSYLGCPTSALSFRTKFFPEIVGKGVLGEGNSKCL